MELLLVFTIGAIWNMAGAFQCGDLHFSSSVVRETEHAQLVYSYAAGYRYNPRIWYILRDRQYTKIYDASVSVPNNWKYQERFHDNRYILTINSVTSSDSGTYVVFCATDDNKTSKPAQLKVSPLAVGQGLCGRLEIINNGSPIGSLVQFKFDTSSPQHTDVTWQVDVNGIFTNLGFESRVETVNNVARTVFVRKLYTTESDSGTYRVRCGDGYVSNIAELTVHVVPPGQPIIVNSQPYPGCASCLLAVLGMPLNIHCLSNNGSAPVDLKLFYNDVKISSAVSSDVFVKSVSVHKQFIVRETDGNATIRCTAKNSAIERPIVTVAGIYLFKAPSDPVIQNHKGVEGKMAAITCISEGGKPAPDMLFLYNSTFLNPETKQTLSRTDGTVRVDSVLYVNLTRNDNGRVIVCRSDILHSRKTKRQILDVKFPPNEVVVIKRRQVSTPQGDTNLTLRCQTGESNPKSTVIWHGLDTIKRAPSDLPVTQGKHGGWYINHDLTISLTRQDNQKGVKCIVLNTAFPSLSLAQSYRFNIPYQPIIQLPGGPNVTTYEGNDVTIHCDVDSNPIAKIWWLKDGAQITESDNTKETSLGLTLFNITMADDRTVYTCSATNNVGERVLANLTLLVKDKSLAFRSVSSDDGSAGVIAAVLGAILFLVVIATITVICLIRRKRKSSHDAYPGVQIHIDIRQPSIHPPVEEPVYNNVTPGDMREGRGTAAEYDQVLPRAQWTTPDNVENHGERTEYAVVIPKSQRQSADIYLNTVQQANTVPVVENTGETAEYAVVIPRSQRRSEDTALDKQQRPDQCTSTTNLVYADLDLPREGTLSNKKSPEQTPTHYVSIDFVKSKDRSECGGAS